MKRPGNLADLPRPRPRIRLLGCRSWEKPFLLPTTTTHNQNRLQDAVLTAEPTPVTKATVPEPTMLEEFPSLMSTAPVEVAAVIRIATIVWVAIVVAWVCVSINVRIVIWIRVRVSVRRWIIIDRRANRYAESHSGVRLHRGQENHESQDRKNRNPYFLEHFASSFRIEMPTFPAKLDA